MTSPTITTKRTIRRFSPLPLGKMLAALYGIVGLVFIPFFLIMGIAGIAGSGRKEAAGGLLVGALFAVLFPFIYAAMGFVFGILGALLYNLLAGWMGGIEVEIE